MAGEDRDNLTDQNSRRPWSDRYRRNCQPQPNRAYSNAPGPYPPAYLAASNSLSFCSKLG
jgi:hypothetical protein